MEIKKQKITSPPNSFLATNLLEKPLIWLLIEKANREEIFLNRDLYKKIRDTKETFHAKTGTMKDRNGMDLIEVEHIKKRCQECTE